MKTNPTPPERPSPAFKAFVESQIQEILQPDRLSSDGIQSPPRPVRRSRLVTPPPPTIQTRLDGYRAAAIAVQNMMEEAYSKRPRKMGGREHLAAYREGYYTGLLLAHCQFAFGEFPQHNATAIEMILSQNEKAETPL